MMRIITGTAKGKRLDSLEGNATRPTSERVKEAIFSALQFDLEGRRVLDLFAGSGQMGLEALSRGAQSVMFVDASMEAMQIVKRNAAHTGFTDRCRFLVSDYRNYIRKAARGEAPPRFDLVFIDPPYATDAAFDALERLAASKLLAPYATVVCECAEEHLLPEAHPLLASLDDLRHKKYGISHVHIMTYTGGNGHE